jgi:hypothetical protein
VLVATGMNVMFGFRTLDPDPIRSQALVDAVRIYPYAQRDNPPATRVISPDGRPWSGDQPRGLEYWERLHGIYQSEVVDERDRFFLAMLKQLGIEKGMMFAPDERLTGILTAAAAAGELMAQANSFAKRSPAPGTGLTVNGISCCSWIGPISAPTATTSCWSAPRGSTRR